MIRYYTSETRHDIGEPTYYCLNCGRWVTEAAIGNEDSDNILCKLCAQEEEAQEDFATCPRCDSILVSGVCHGGVGSEACGYCRERFPNPAICEGCGYPLINHPRVGCAFVDGYKP